MSTIVAVGIFVAGLVVEKNIGLFSKGVNFIEGAWAKLADFAEGAWATAASWLKKLRAKD